MNVIKNYSSVFSKTNMVDRVGSHQTYIKLLENKSIS